MKRVVQPSYISLTDWAATLVSDFGNENLPQLLKEDQWQEWGMILCNTGIFARANIPPPFVIAQGSKKQIYTGWSDWAARVYCLVNNELFIENSRGTDV